VREGEGVHSIQGGGYGLVGEIKRGRSQAMRPGRSDERAR